MNTQQLTEDSKVILLLCCRFGKRPENGLPGPLTTREYNILVKWLKENDLRPGDLITSVGHERLQQATNFQLDLYRVKALLERGTTLALAIEKWLNKGLWILTRSDGNYPKILLDRLKQSAPPIIFGAGNPELLSRGGLAIVGSRNFDAEAKEFTSAVARAAARDNMQIVSGGARGVDQEAMLSALQEKGTVVGVLSEGLQKAIVSGKYRQALRDKSLVLVSPYQPEARFTVGNAMGRNKYIYALAEFGLIVSSSYNTGGTWAGVTEELRKDGGIPIFVRANGNVPRGNNQLLKKGAMPFPEKPWIPPIRTLLLSVAQVTNQPEQLLLVDKSWDYAKVSEPRIGYSTPQDHAAYNAILPIIMRHLEKPKTRDKLKTEMNVQMRQLEAWLKQAIKEGHILKKGRPVKYYLTPDSQKELPFSNK